MEKKNQAELSQILKSRIDDTASELENLLPDFDMMPKQDDAAVKQAILNLTPDGLNKLYQQYGQQGVTDFLNEFSAHRRW